MSLLFMYLWVRCLVLSRCTLNYPERIRGYAPFMVGLNKRVYCSDDGASLGFRVLLVDSLSAIRKGSKTGASLVRPDLRFRFFAPST